MRQTLRLLTSVSLVINVFLGADAQQVGINRNGAAPSTKAILDLDVSATSGNPYQGMLIPRMTFAQRLAINSLVAADKGLWVYQTDDGTDPGGDPTLDGEYAHGYWYYEGVLPSPKDWVRWSAGNGSWLLNGNANTTVGTHYLGTPAGSNDDLFLKTTNSLLATDKPTMRILGSGTDAGFVGINLPAATAPVERVEVDGGLQIGYTATNNQGTIRFENTSAVPNRWHTGSVNTAGTLWQRMENAETRYINQTYCPIVQQCVNPPSAGPNGVVIKGTYDGAQPATVAGGPIYTPFATQTGGSQQLGFRVQYIYPGSELLAAGLCPGPITKISFYALSNDGPGCIALVNCPDIKVDIRMGNSALASFGAVVPSSLVAVGTDWDNPTEISAVLNTNSGTQQLIQTGWVDFPLSGAGFNWTGGNLIIDVSWLRASSNGVSPAVQLEETLGYGASKWVQAGNNPQLSHGDLFNDNPLTVNTKTGITDTRPVTRFFGKVTQTAYGAATTGTFLNYGGGLIVDHNAAPATWADANYRGPGSIRASIAVYDGNTLLSDHVFDRYYDGDVAPEDVAAAEQYDDVSLPELKNYLEKERHLPNMPSREEWELHGNASLGRLQTGLWESVETQALYITELEKDLSALEAMAFGNLKDPAELEELIGSVMNSRRLTEAQKLHLTHALQTRLNAQKDNK